MTSTQCGRMFGRWTREVIHDGSFTMAETRNAGYATSLQETVDQTLRSKNPWSQMVSLQYSSLNIWLMMVITWLIYGEYMVNIWLIYGEYMVNIWLIYG